MYLTVPVETCSIKKKKVYQSAAKLLLGIGKGKYFHGPVLGLVLMHREALSPDNLLSGFGIPKLCKSWLVYMGTAHPSVPTVPVIPTSLQAEAEASQLSKVFISDSSLTFLMAGTVKAQDGHILCGSRITL